MYNEEQYIYHTFTNNFIQNKKGNVILYGTGIHTGKLLSKLDGKEIRGLMDVKRTGETFWGYHVLSYEEVRRIPDVCIVIIARDAVIHTVYRRIEGFCRENKIPVYDINGNDLASKQIQTDRHGCFLLNCEELLKKIEEADYVSFDIFDTLLTRRLLSPQDVFRYMDGINPVSNLEFSRERKRAEDTVRNIKNPTIYDIYDSLQKNTGISDTEKTDLLALEIETENAMLCRRESMCGILKHAKDCGKKVCLISDMYLTGEIMERILREHCITDYDGIFVSCDYSAGKQEGLFQIVREKLCVSGAEKMLHIGDNFFSDICAAKDAGYDTYQIYSPREMYERSIYPMVLSEPDSMEEELLLGKFVSLAYNNPFGSYRGNGILVLKDAGQIAELFIAPVILKYMFFLIQTIMNDRLDFVIFPSRDGRLLQKLYNIIKELKQPEINLPDSIYLYVSRRAALAASAYTGRDIRNILLIDDTRSLKDMLGARFGIKAEEILKSGDEEISPDMVDCLLKLCADERSNYQTYISGSGISEHKLPAFVDFIAVGTVQAALERLTGKKLRGVYFWKRNSSEGKYEKLCVESLYKPSGDFDMSANIYRFYYFLENILSSEEPSLMSVTKEGKPCFYREQREKKDIEQLNRIHKVLEAYVRDMVRIFPDIMDCTASVRLYDEILGLLSRELSEFDEEEIFHMNNTDEFMGRVVTSMNR